MANALGTPGGVVTDEHHRLDQAGLLAAQTSSLAVRTGVMAGPGSTAIVTGTSATGTMTVNIAAHHWVSTRGTADGVYLGTKEASTTVNIAAAPGSNSRIDVVWSKQNDSGSTISADGSTAESYGVTTGTAAASPTKPAIPVGAVEIATVTVAVGATNTLGAGVTIANTAAQVVARGARIPVRTQAERDALTVYGGLEVYRIDTGAVELYSGVSGTWITTTDPGTWSTYTTTWSTNGTVQPAVNNGTLTSRYRKQGRTCDVDIYLTIGSTTDLGNGDFRFTLPFSAISGREHLMLAKGYLAGAIWSLSGVGLVASSGGTTLIPYLPTSPTDGNNKPARNQASGGSATGTSYPQVPGAYAWVSGSNLAISGRFETAS